MANVTIELTQPLPGHAGLVKAVVIREPTMGDILKHGEPTVIGKTGDSVYMIEDHDVMRAYVDALIVEPNPLLVYGACLEDAMRIKDAILSFFTAARMATLPRQPPSSSST